MRRRLAALVSLAAWLAAPAAAAPAIKNGFSLRGATVPEDEILEGGPPRDGIHAVDDPRFVPPDAASWVLPPNGVIGVELNGVARAYPVHVMEYHQIVNDEFGGVPVAVTYDPLTGVPRAFRREHDGRTLRFGVSGLIYNTGFLMYDRETSSLWSQFQGDAISGPLARTKLRELPVRQEPYGAWLSRHPETLVLERPQPRQIDYRYSPFSAYWMSEKIPFPPKSEDPRYHPKEVVLGIEVGGVARAYLGSIVTAAGGSVEDRVAGRRIEIRYDSDLALFTYEAPADVRVTDAYWFAWKAFHPGTEIWSPPAKTGP
jgi:hypothetical protein